MDAGDFVEFINGDITVKENIEISTAAMSQTSRRPVIAAKLSENKVFVAYRYISGKTSYLYGCVYIIDGNNITKGIDTQLNDKMGYNLSITVLSENKVCIIDGNGSYLYGTVCEIDGTLIQAGTTTLLKSGTHTAYYLSIIALSSSKVMIAYNFDSYDYAYGMICTINELKITVETNKQLSIIQNGVNSISMTKLSNNEVSIVHIDSNDNLHILVCTIEDINITLKFNEILTYARAASYYSVCVLALSQNKILIIYVDNRARLQACICIIGETAIISKSTFQLNSMTTKGIISAKIISPDRVLIVFNYDNQNQYLYGTVCTINGMAASEGLITQISNESYSCSMNPSIILLSPNLVFLGYSKTTNNYASGMICKVEENKINKMQKDNLVSGIAKKSGTEGQVIDVVVPDYENESGEI